MNGIMMVSGMDIKVSLVNLLVTLFNLIVNLLTAGIPGLFG